MRSTFFGLEIGRSGLLTHQKAIDVTSNNMANASTPGYSRQRAEIVTMEPFSYPGFSKVKSALQLGTGVDVDAVVRLRDELIDKQIQSETTTLGYWESRQQMLDKLELIINEPSDANIRTSIDDFWAAINEVIKDPALPEARSALRQKTLTMTTTIRSDYENIKQLRWDANDRIIQGVSQINDLATKIAGLNDRIGKITALGDNPNDLLDKRDAYVEELSKIVNIQYSTDKFNYMTISITGIPIVNGITANKILTVNDTENEGLVKLKWEAPTDEPVRILSGSLHGLFQVRDEDLPTVLRQLNDFASTIITNVNQLHRQGYGLDEKTGFDFFTGTDASNIDLAEAIMDDNIVEIDGKKWEVGLLRIAAADSVLDLSGDGNTLMKMIFEIKDKKILNNSTATLGEFLGSMVADIGERSSAAQTNADHQNFLIGNLDQRRQEVCGVSLDEEMTNLVKFQHGYNAAAKIITTVDEMLDVIVNRLKV